jgi:hypothetical protein
VAWVRHGCTVKCGWGVNGLGAQVGREWWDEWSDTLSGATSDTT